MATSRSQGLFTGGDFSSDPEKEGISASVVRKGDVKILAIGMR